MGTLVNLARMGTSTTGTGSPVTLTTAIPGCLTFAAAGVVDGQTVSYGIRDANNSEIGQGVYSAVGPTLTRNVMKSTNGNLPINMAAGAQVYITALAEDIPVAATAAEFIGNSAPAKMLTPGAAWSAAAPLAVGAIASLTPDFGVGIDFTWTLNSATGALNNPTNQKPGQKGVIYIQQDATGNRLITTWGNSWKFAGGTKPTLSTAANALDAIAYCVQASGVIACTFQGGFA